MKIFKVTLTFDTGFFTAGSSHGASTGTLLNDQGVPYIPATHIKGIMRTEAERILRGAGHDLPCAITGDPAVRLCPEVTDGKFGCDVCRLFGAPNAGGGGKYREGKLRFTDLAPTASVTLEGRIHIALDRSTLTYLGVGGRSDTKGKGVLFTLRQVPAGAIFQGHILIRDNLTESEDKLLRASLHSASQYGFGGSRSRGLGVCRAEMNEILEDEYGRR